MIDAIAVLPLLLNKSKTISTISYFGNQTLLLQRPAAAVAARPPPLGSGACIKQGVSCT